MKNTIVFLIFTVLISSYLLALNPEKSLDQFIQDNWTSDNGLPQNSVLNIIQTRPGYLWMGTEEGFIRFDGVKFEVLDQGNLALESHNSKMLLEDRSNPWLWIATQAGGLARYDYITGEVKSYGEKEGIPNRNVTYILQDKTGGLWIGTRGGLCYMKDGEVTAKYTKQQGLPTDEISSMVMDKDSTLWIGSGSSGHLSYMKDKTIRDAVRFPGNIQSLFIDSQQKFWVSTQKGLFRYDMDSNTYRVGMNELNNSSVSSVFEDSEHNLWIGTDEKGIYRVKNLGRSEPSREDRIYITSVAGFFEDKEHSLWVGTKGAGVFRLREGKFTTIRGKSVFKNDITFALYESSKGGMWVGTFGGGLYHLKDGRASLLKYQDILGEESSVLSVYEEKNGTLWLGINGAGLLRYKNDDDARLFSKDTGLSSNNVQAIFQDSKGRIWVGTRDVGVNLIEDDKIRIFNTDDGMTSTSVDGILETAGGVIVFSTRDGLTQYKDGAFSRFAPEIKDVQIFSAVEDASTGSYYFPSEKGLYIYRNEKVYHINMKNGLLVQNIFNVIQDREKNFWITSNKGIMFIEKEQIEQFIEGKTDRVKPKLYSVTDGLATGECDGGTQYNVFRSGDGRLWFATARGVAVIDPSNIQINMVEPPVYITAVHGDNVKISGEGEGTEFAAGTFMFEFNYTGLSFLFSEKMQFKYKLEGFDKEWIDAGDRRSAFYTNLSPGRFVFRVIAANSDGVWNMNGDEFKFRLKPYFYQTVWFYMLLGIVAVFFIVGFIRIKALQIKEREKEMAQLIETRTRDLKDIIKHVQLMSMRLREISELISGSTGTTAEKSNDTYSMIDRVSSTLSNISGKLTTTKDEVVSMNSIVTKLSEKADSSSMILNDAVKAMDRIASSAGEIKNIIEVVSEIAFKTNLLSLNAAIEAARAGDAGKGFAVVAESVRELSVQTAGSLNSIKTLINDAVSKVVSGKESVDDSAKFFSEIIGEFKEISDRMSTVNQIIERHAAEVWNINNALAEIRKITQDNTHLVDDVYKASQQLKDETNRLGKEVDRINI